MMAAQVALKRQQAAEDAIVLGLRACSQRDGGTDGGDIPMMTPGPLWGPESITKSNNDSDSRSPHDPNDDELGKCV